VSTAIGAAINALTPKPDTPGAAGYTVTARGANLDHQIIYGETRVAGAVVADFLSGEGGAEGTRFLHRVQVMAGHEIESYEAVYMNSYKVSKWQVRDATTEAGGGQVIDDVTDIGPYVNQLANILIPVEFVEVASDGTETVVEDLSYKKWRGLAMQFWTGADDQPASTKLIADIPNGQWTSDHRLRGRAYMYVRMGRDAEGDNFPTGVPEITAVVKGRKVYDPREVSHDPDDKSTWEWSDNPALCVRDYLTQDFGLGEKDIQVDDGLVETAANVCDQTADDGSTRFTCNGAFTTGIQPYDLLNSILSSMGGMLWYAQGQWRMKPAYWTVPTESFNEDDFRSAISVSTRHSRKDNFNVVEGAFRGPANNYALTTFPQVTNVSSTGTSVNAGSFVVDDVYIINALGDTDWNAVAGTTGVTYASGDSFKAATTGSGTGTAFSTFNAYLQTDGNIQSSIDLEMPFTDTPEEARRIARIVLERNRQQLTVRASFGLKAFRVQVGDVISLSLERFGWLNKTFEVTEWSFGNVDQYDIQIELTLREISENVFDEIDDGVVFELDNANVPSPLAGLTVSNLTATAGGFTATDGTFVPNVLVDWDSIVNSNVAEYIVEWGRAAFSFADYGGEVTDTGSFTTREQFIFDAYNDILLRNPDQSGFDFYNTGGGSGLTETQIRLQLQNSPEKRAISGSVRVGGETTEYTISPAADDSMYSIRVKAINDFGTSSNWATVTVNVGKDDTVPSAPANLTVTGSYGSAMLNWDAVTTNTDSSVANDIFLYNIYRGTSADPTTLVDTTAGTGFSDSGLADGTTYHYRVRAVDFSGNLSAYSNNDSTTTNATLVDGTDGNTVAVVNIYLRSSSTPSTPTGGSFNFDTLTLTPPSGWSISVPSGTDPVYVSVATASITGTSGTDSSITWSTPGLLAQNGDDGITGKSVYTATVFQRSATTPSAPSGGSFNFGTNVLTPPSGWYLDIPAGTDPSYGTRFVFSITGDTGSQTAGTWSTPFKVAEDGQNGADGISTYQASIFRRSSSTPSTPTGGSYNFGTNTLTPPSGWSISVPSGTDPLYTSTTLASIQGVSGTDSSLTWTTPVILARDGVDGNPGVNGDRTYTGRVYYNSLVESPGPGTISETSVTFNESTGEFTGGTFSAGTGWRHTQPKVEVSSLSLLEWSASYTVTVSGDLSYPQTSVPNTEFSFGTPSGAAQIATDLASDNFNGAFSGGSISDPGTEGWAIARDSGDAVFNDVTVRGDIRMTDLNSEIDLTTNPLPTVTIGIRMQPSTADEIIQTWQNSSSQYTMSAYNFGGSALEVRSNVVSGSGDAIYAVNQGTAGSTCMDAVSTRSDGATGPGLCQIALSGFDGGYGIFIPAASEAGGLDGSGNGFSPFTGTHMGMLLKVTFCEPGDILVDHDMVVSTISDSFTEVVVSSSNNQAGAIGVLQKRKGSWIIPPAFIDRPATKAAQAAAPEGTKADNVLILDPSVYHDDYDLVDINSVGEGAINVCGEGGNISKGDLIVTSSTPGKGMKQSDDIVRSYTVAKAREDVTFADPTEVKMVACIYLCG
jgi:hypothetical protein